jgi:hypothetical protein
MGYIKWGGKKFYPQTPKPYKADINELMKPLSEKTNKGNVWGSIIMDVRSDSATPAPTPVPVPSVEYVSSGESTATASSYTFNGLSIGDGGGAIAVTVIANGGDSGRAMTNATFNGGVTNNYGKAGSGVGGINPSVGLVWKTLTGTSTVNLVVSFSGNMDRCSVQVYRLKNLIGLDPLYLEEGIASPGTSASITFPSTSGNSLGVVVGADGDLSGPTDTLSFTNANAVFNDGSAPGTVGISGKYDSTPAGTYTVTMNSSASNNLVLLGLLYQ